MSEFRKYASRVHSLALETREAAKKIEETYNRAADAKRQAGNDPVKIARAEADYQEALRAKNRWRMEKPYEIERQLSNIRGELAEAVKNAFAADPTALDPATMELLKSGILSSDEYQSLMNKALEAGNVTMARLVASYAEREAAAFAEKYGVSDPRATTLRAVSYQGKRLDGSDYFNAYDVLANTLMRCVSNDAMWEHWEPLTSEIIQSF